MEFCLFSNQSFDVFFNLFKEIKISLKSIDYILCCAKSIYLIFFVGLKKKIGTNQKIGNARDIRDDDTNVFNYIYSRKTFISNVFRFPYVRLLKAMHAKKFSD